jgi:hypothetical protein
MSHAYGRVRFDDGTVLHFEYDGTSDVCISTLRTSRKEVWDHWRDQGWNRCTCGRDQPVEIAEDYGGGQWWAGRACRHCMAITDGLREPEDEPTHTGLPDWWPVGERS